MRLPRAVDPGLPTGVTVQPDQPIPAVNGFALSPASSFIPVVGCQHPFLNLIPPSTFSSTSLRRVR